MFYICSIEEIVERLPIGAYCEDRHHIKYALRVEAFIEAKVQRAGLIR